MYKLSSRRKQARQVHKAQNADLIDANGIALKAIGPYRYRPLRSKSQNIRLMILLPGVEQAQIHIHLETTRFRKEDCPRYEALSYTWGPLEDPACIVVGRSSNTGTLSVTQNLAQALRYLRYPDRSRVLWIDAICINQQDLNERSTQVQRMPDIYSKAERVVVWLGPESCDSDIALDCIDTISKKVTADWDYLRLHATSAESEHHWSDRDTEMPFTNVEHESLFNFFYRPWFGRLWIWQEIHLTNRETLAMVGPRTTLWESIRVTAFCLNYKRMGEGTSPKLHGPRIHQVYTLCSGGDTKFLWGLLDITTRSLCSDPRDRIYALLSLLLPIERDGIIPDYTKRVAEVYKDVMVRWSQNLQALRLLQTVEMSESMQEAPSWVPDWSATRTTRTLDLCYAESPVGYEMNFSFHHDKLEARGVTIDTIKSVEKFRLSQEGSLPVRERIQQMGHEIKRMSVFTGIGMQGNDSHEESTMSVLCQVISANYLSELFLPLNTDLLSLERAKEIWCKHMKSESMDVYDTIPRDDLSFLSTFYTYCYNRSLFLTSEGHIGFGPKAMEAGDLVVMLLNCKVPMVLRPTSENQFLVVGEAYVHGFMDREALLGPLPPSVRSVNRWNAQDGSDVYAYFDQSSESVQAEDPRLGQLPDGWTRKSHPQSEFYTWFVNEELCDELIGGLDPRFTTEELIERGVDLQTFDII